MSKKKRRKERDANSIARLSELCRPGLNAFSGRDGSTLMEHVLKTDPNH